MQVLKMARRNVQRCERLLVRLSARMDTDRLLSFESFKSLLNKRELHQPPQSMADLGSLRILGVGVRGCRQVLKKRTLEQLDNDLSIFGGGLGEPT